MQGSIGAEGQGTLMRTGDFRKFGTYTMDHGRPPPNSLTARVLAEPLFLEPYVVDNGIFLCAFVFLHVTRSRRSVNSRVCSALHLRATPYRLCEVLKYTVRHIIATIRSFIITAALK